MALLKKTLNTLAEKCGCGDDETSGTPLLSFLVKRNQAEEEETAHRSEVMKMVGDDDEMELGDETDTVDMDMEDPDAVDPENDDIDDDAIPAEVGEEDPEMDIGDPEMDPDAEDIDMNIDPDAEGEYSDADIEGEDDDEKRLGMIQSLLSMR